VTRTAPETPAPRAPRFWQRHALWLLLVAAAPCIAPRSDRSNPVCAVQNCATGEILDDGCSHDGRCKSCINDCGQRVAPHTRP
jgi:hypothetical protein